MLTHHQIFGIDLDATPAEVRSGYRKAARRSHPDHGGTTGEFAAVQEALTVLSDPGSRKAYENWHAAQADRAVVQLDQNPEGTPVPYRTRPLSALKALAPGWKALLAATLATITGAFTLAILAHEDNALGLLATVYLIGVVGSLAAISKDIAVGEWASRKLIAMAWATTALFVLVAIGSGVLHHNPMTGLVWAGITATFATATMRLKHEARPTTFVGPLWSG